MSVPSCSTCRHAVPGTFPQVSALTCRRPGLAPHYGGDPWYAEVIRAFETDEQGRPWCGSAGTWHEPKDEDQAA